MIKPKILYATLMVSNVQGVSLKPSWIVNIKRWFCPKLPVGERAYNLWTAWLWWYHRQHRHTQILTIELDQIHGAVFFIQDTLSQKAKILISNSDKDKLVKSLFWIDLKTQWRNRSYTEIRSSCISDILMISSRYGNTKNQMTITFQSWWLFKCYWSNQINKNHFLPWGAS